MGTSFTRNMNLAKPDADQTDRFEDYNTDQDIIEEGYQVQGISASAIDQFTAVYISGCQSGTAVYSPATAGASAVGISKTTTAVSGATIFVGTWGVITNVLWTWDPCSAGGPWPGAVFVDPNIPGKLTQTPSVECIGRATSPTELLLLPMMRIGRVLSDSAQLKVAMPDGLWHLSLDTTSGSGGLVRFFHGAGGPSASTLAAGTYVEGDLYLDDTNKNLWVCRTGGSESTSVWNTVMNTTEDPNAFLRVPAWFSNAAVSGAPSATTLVAGHYSIGDLYWDRFNFVLYVCKQAGTESTSVWTTITGGGGVTSVSSGDNAVVVSPTTGATVVTLNKTSNVAGLLVPMWYTGAGVPSASTLAAGSYGVGDLYWDSTNKDLYTCETAGSASTSVWVTA